VHRVTLQVYNTAARKSGSGQATITANKHPLRTQSPSSQSPPTRAVLAREDPIGRGLHRRALMLQSGATRAGHAHSEGRQQVHTLPPEQRQWSTWRSSNSGSVAYFLVEKRYLYDRINMEKTLEM